LASEAEQRPLATDSRRDTKLIAGLTQASRFVREELQRLLGERAAVTLIAKSLSRSGEQAAYEAIKAGEIPSGSEGIPEIMKRIREAGLGSPEVLEHDWDEGWLLVGCTSSQDVAEIEDHLPTDSPVCHRLRGFLEGAYAHLRTRANLVGDGIRSVEVACTAMGHESCRIAIGSEKVLTRHGIAMVPPGSPNARGPAPVGLSSPDAPSHIDGVVDDVPFGVASIDISGSISFANQRTLDLMELPLQNVTGTPFISYIHPDDKQAASNAMRELAGGKAGPSTMEVRIIGAKGKVSRCAASAFGVRDETGHVGRFHAVIMDLSDLPDAPRDEPRFREALRSSPVVYLELEPDGRIAHANSTACELLGLDEKDIKGTPFTRFLKKDQIARAIEPLLSVAAGKSDMASCNCDLVGPDGTEHTFRFFFVPDGPKDQPVTRILVPSMDLTRMGLLAKAGERLSHRFDSLLTSTEALVFETTPDGTLQSLWGPVDSVLGYEMKELLGLPFPPFLHSDDLSGVSTVLRRYVPTGPTRDRNVRDRTQAVKSTLCRLRRKDGSWGTFRMSAAPVASTEDEPGGVIGILRDMTDDAERIEKLASKDATITELLESERIWVVVCDSSGNVAGLSRAYEQSTGFDRVDRIGRPIAALLARGSDASADVFLRKGKAGDPPVSVRLAFERQGDDSSCVIDLEVGAISDPTGKHIGYAGIGRDVTLEYGREAIEIERNELAREVAVLRSEVQGNYGLDSIVGQDPKMRSIFETVLAVSRTQATVLIQGETGTGKELIAKAIHYNSPRHGRPLVKVDCGALAGNLLESELFGHVKGAFTGAISDRPGRFELAHMGTIFLDEIHNLPFNLQAKLLRVVQDGRFEKVGGTRTHDVDVRIIAATNEHLAELVEREEFRKDLYYRLNVIPVQLPALRDRRGDIPHLVRSFITKFAERHKRDVTSISREALDWLLDYDWPGNVRELENIVEQSVVFAKANVIQLEDMRLPPTSMPGAGAPLVPGKLKPLKQALEDPERNIILESLERSGGNRKRAAEILGISRSAFYEKLKKHGLTSKKRDT
jgi:PAS domain S-box-containing protein